MRFTEILETLDTRRGLEWVDISTEDESRITARFVTHGGTFVVSFSRPYYDIVWSVQFTRDGSLEMSKQGGGFHVMSMVVKAMEDFIEMQRPRELTVSMDIKEPSRRKAYLAILSKIADRQPYAIELRGGAYKYSILNLHRHDDEPEVPHKRPQAQEEPERELTPDERAKRSQEADELFAALQESAKKVKKSD